MELFSKGISVIELTEKESQRINGGGPAWKWLGKVVGAVLDAIEESAEWHMEMYNDGIMIG